MKYLRLIWKNVFRKKTRTVLTTGSIVLVLVLIVVLVSLLRAMEADPSGGKGANRLVVQHATGLANFLPLAHRERIAQIPGVVAVTPETWFGGIYKDEKPENWFGQLSADPEIFFDKIFDDATIKPEVLAEWKATRNGFVAGEAIAKKHGWKKGQQITLRGTYIPINLDLRLHRDLQRRGRDEHLLPQRGAQPGEVVRGQPRRGDLLHEGGVRRGPSPGRRGDRRDVREQRLADEDHDREAVPAVLHGDDGQRQGDDQRDLARHPLRRHADRRRTPWPCRPASG